MNCPPNVQLQELFSKWHLISTTRTDREFIIVRELFSKWHLISTAETLWYQKSATFSSCRIRTYSYQLQMTHENCSQNNRSRELFDIKRARYLCTVQLNLVILNTQGKMVRSIVGVNSKWPIVNDWKQVQREMGLSSKQRGIQITKFEMARFDCSCFRFLRN